MKTHVAIVIKNSNNEILFVQRSLKKKTLPGCWSFPSGTVEEGEEFFDATKRESREELGIEVEPLKIFAQVELKEFSVKLVFVLCKITKGIPQNKQPEENQRIEWMTLDKFFNIFSDEQIGHGLIWLRKNKELITF